MVFVTFAYLTAAIDTRLEAFRGGPAFWVTVEQRLHKMADEPDMPAEKKEAILKSLRKLSAKYRPYIDALNGH